MWGRLTMGVVAGCLVALCAEPGLASLQAGAAPVCGPANAQTIVADSVARVYQQDQTTYGCAVPGGQAIKLGGGPFTHAPVPPSAGPVALSRTIVAYGQTVHGIDFASTGVVVRRLTNGSQLKSFPALTAEIGPEAVTSVGSIVVKADGAVAWIGTGRSLGTKKQGTQVFRAPGTHAELLDHSRGRAIAADSLRLHRSRLTWKRGGVTRRAKLH